MKKKGLLALLIGLMAIIIFIGGIITLVLADILNSDEVETSKEEISEEYKYQMEKAIVTNIKNSNRYVKCKLTFKLENIDDQNIFSTKSYILNDIIIETLRSFTEEAYESPNIKERIGKTLNKSITEKLKITGIRSIYFEELITQ